MKANLLITQTLGLSLLFAPCTIASPQQSSAPAVQPVKQAGVLTSSELEKLIPASVYFQGQSATVQVRNSGGVRFPDGNIMFAVKVDTGGYSTSIQERYQDYLITENSLQLGEGSAAKTLAAGAYGIGFVAQGLLVMDIGGHTLLTLPSRTDAELRRPTPLQIVAHGSDYRLYSGRAYVSFQLAP